MSAAAAAPTSGGSAGADAVGDVIDSYQDGLSARTTNAVLIQIATQLVIGVACMAIFMALRGRNKLIFMPRFKYSSDEQRPPRISDQPLGWVPPIMRLREPEMLEKIGLDGVVFLRFLRMSRWICTVVAVGAISIILPINYIYNQNKVSSQQGFLTKITIINVSGNWLYAHVVFTYVVCFITYGFIYFNYRRIVELRWQWFKSPAYQNALYARSIMVTHVGTQYRSDAGLQALLDQTLVPYPTTAVHIGRKVGTLPELVELHNDTVRELEQVLTTFLRKGDSKLDKRPTMHVGGAAGLGGRKVDTIDYLTDKIKRLEEKIKDSREAISDRKAETFGFASFGTVAWAHMVAKKLGTHRVKGARFELASPPHDIIWTNLAISDAGRRSRQILGSLLLVLAMAFFVLPVTAAALVANMTALTRYVGFLQTWSDDSNWSFSAVLGIAPVAINALAQVLIAATIRWLARYMVATTEMKLDRSVLARYFAFIFITQFILFNILSVIVQTAEKIVLVIGDHKGAEAVWQEFKKVPGEIQGTYISMGNYWIGWLAAKAAGPPLDMLQIPTFFMAWLRTKVFGRTPREIREWTKPAEFDFSVYVANFMLLLVVAFVYAPLSPFVPLFAMAAFFVASWLYKYQLLYVADTRCESGGRFARMIVNRMLFSLVIMSLFMVLTIGLQLGWPYSATAAPPILLTILFKMLIKRQFDDRFSYYSPDGLEADQAHVHQGDARKGRLLKRFGHPSLHAELFTPMVHKEHQHLLSRVYSGRTEETEEMLDDHKVEGEIAGGLTFAAIGEHDLQYSRMQYLREREEDNMSLNSSNALSRRAGALGDKNGEAYGPEFERQRLAYLAAGRPDPFGHRDSYSGPSYPPSQYAGSSYAGSMFDPSQQPPAHVRFPATGGGVSGGARSSYDGSKTGGPYSTHNQSQVSLMNPRYSFDAAASVRRGSMGPEPHHQPFEQVPLQSDHDRFAQYAAEQQVGYPPTADAAEEHLRYSPPAPYYSSPRQGGSPHF